MLHSWKIWTFQCTKKRGISDLLCVQLCKSNLTLFVYEVWFGPQPPSNISHVPPLRASKLAGTTPQTWGWELKTLCESSAGSRQICVALTKHLKSWNKNVNSQIRCYGVIYFFLISADECPWGTSGVWGGALNFLMSSIMCCHYVIFQAPLSRREQACHAFTQGARLEGFP